MNLGYFKSDKTQNAFTAYLLVALNRNNYAFTRKQKLSQSETIFLDDIEDKNNLNYLLLDNLPWLDQFENEMLVKLISKMSQKTQDIIYMKISCEMSLPQIATRLNMHTQKASAIYYRALTSLKKSLGEMKK